MLNDVCLMCGSNQLPMIRRRRWWFLVPFGRVINDAFLLCCQPFYGIDNLIELEVKKEDSMPVWSFVLLLQKKQSSILFLISLKKLFYMETTSKKFSKVWEEVFYFESKNRLTSFRRWSTFCEKNSAAEHFHLAPRWIEAPFFVKKLKYYMMDSMNNI